MKMLSIVLAVVLICAVGMLYYFGVFNAVKMEKIKTGPYFVACLDHIGPYKNIGKKFDAAKQILNDQAIIPVTACGIYYDDPKSTPSDKLRSKAGFILDGDVKVNLLEKITIEEREVISAKIKASPMVAPFKVYPAITKWAKSNNCDIMGPSIEIYGKGGIIEVQMPIAEKVKK